LPVHVRASTADSLELAGPEASAVMK